MKPLPSYLSLFAILFQAIFASTFLNEKDSSLSTNKTASFKSRRARAKAKPVVGKLVWKKKLPTSTKKKAQNKHGKSKDVLVKEDKSILLIELLPKELVEIVIGYFDDDTYPIIVSTHNWSLKDRPIIAVDSARLYAPTHSEGLKGLSHSLANNKEDERRLIEFGDPQWSDYGRLSSSHDGRYVFFSYRYTASSKLGKQPKRGTRWFTQSNESEDRRLKRVTFDGEESPYGLLSRDGQTLCAYSDGMNPITRVYRLREEAGKDPAGFMKFELNGAARAISGNANRVMIAKPGRLEIHEISKDASKLVCQIYMTDLGYAYALNGDGSEAAFYVNGGLRIVEVNKVSSSAMEQPAVVIVKASRSLGWISQLVYDDRDKLHLLHSGHKVSFFDPSTKKFILLETPQEGQGIIYSAISPNADYIAFLRYVGAVGNGENIYRTIVKGKLSSADFERLFGYKADKNK